MCELKRERSTQTLAMGENLETVAAQARIEKSDRLGKVPGVQASARNGTLAPPVGGGASTSVERGTNRAILPLKGRPA